MLQFKSSMAKVDWTYWSDEEDVDEEEEGAILQVDLSSSNLMILDLTKVYHSLTLRTTAFSTPLATSSLAFHWNSSKNHT